MAKLGMRQYGDLPDGSGRCLAALVWPMKHGLAALHPRSRDFALTRLPGGEGPGNFLADLSLSI